MIRAAVTGGTTQVAGEIIKLLINHPDIEIAWVLDPQAEGALISQVHKGLRGETYMRFCARPDMDKIDVIFLCFDEPGEAIRFAQANQIPENVKIIDLSGDFLGQSTFADGDDWIFGLPELCRKPMVRGGKHTSLPQPLTSAVLLSLIPLAKNHLLNEGDIHVTAAITEEEAEPGEMIALIDIEQADDIVRGLRSLDPDFNTTMTFMVMCGGWKRGISVATHFRSSISEEDAIKMFNDYYDDHNFTFISSGMPNLTEVVGTNKCVINIQRVGDRLVINTVIDDLIKGAAAMAVHDMNLLFGLQERVGLMLKTHSC
ncbi:MAG: hypothetical protein NC111_07310 [Bacteroides sp.]|nr:hypothetical protein [Bacteroides sp.]MCM1414085.1 hypothetical protein [Bacteroides sp.]MCM1472316.1 hypothetical protein [Bacteroides sp.]